MSHIIEKDWMTVAGLRAVCLVVLYGERKSHRCGYVAVPEGHPLFGVGYSDNVAALAPASQEADIGKKSPILLLTAGVGAPEGETIRTSPDVAFDVHGRLTFANTLYAIKDPKLWWFGFDCHHCDDADIEPDPTWPSFREAAFVRELDYVEAECESLAGQIKAIFP